MKNELYEHLKGNRGVGHTRLMIDGARNANYPFFIIGADMRHANNLAREMGNTFAIPITIGSNQMRGSNHPVLIDGHTFTTTCEDYIREIRDQREALLKKKAELELLNYSVEKIKTLPWWIRLITPLYKKRINKCLER